ncbi:MAG TPA: SDR family oxidoreductase [Thermomicrobiales bacterium]|nr:SDR family oxidoreductase [Thermomicrobiales bacterium]
MDLGLQDRVYVVGGGSKGLGRAVAGALVAEGARVLLVSRDEGELAQAVAELGQRARSVAVDVADPSAAETIGAAVDREFGRLDGVLVNAGGPPPGEALALTDEQWRQSYELLLGGPLRLLRTLVPKMDNGGAILFITSSSVRQPIPNLDTSNVLRPGVAALAKVLAQELGPKIRVNSIGPGRFDTGRVRSLDQQRAQSQGITVDEQRERMSKTIPLRRYGEPEELGRFAAFLLSPAASYISGVAAMADGAMVSALP